MNDYLLSLSVALMLLVGGFAVLTWLARRALLRRVVPGQESGFVAAAIASLDDPANLKTPGALDLDEEDDKAAINPLALTSDGPRVP